MLESNETGLQLLQSNLESFLKTVTTFAILHTFGKVLFAKELLISIERGVEIDFLIILKIFVGILLLLFFNVLIMSHVSSSLIGFIEKLLLFGVVRCCA